MITNSVFKTIKNLPDNPQEKITWVCYNQDMKKSASHLIGLLKGERYLANVEIVTREELDATRNKNVYYSPDLFDHLGNGSN